MGKPTAPRSNRTRDSFFIKRKGGKVDKAFSESSNKGETDQPFTKHSAANSGSFFVTTSEKQKILKEKEARKMGKQKFPKREEKVKTNRSNDDKTKKPFDKKKWRLQKYSKKYKLQQWEEKRKKTVLHEYYKQIKDDEPKFDVQKIYEQHENDEEEAEGNSKQEEIENENNLNRNIIKEQVVTVNNEEEGTTSQTRKNKAHKKAHLEYQRIQEEKIQKKQEQERKKSEKAEVLKQYKEKKLERYRKLNKKTKKGQPIMKYRMEMLLKQIQKSV